MPTNPCFSNICLEVVKKPVEFSGDWIIDYLLLEIKELLKIKFSYYSGK